MGAETDSNSKTVAGNGDGQGGQTDFEAKTGATSLARSLRLSADRCRFRQTEGCCSGGSARSLPAGDC